MAIGAPCYAVFASVARGGGGDSGGGGVLVVVAVVVVMGSSPGDLLVQWGSDGNVVVVVVGMAAVMVVHQRPVTPDLRPPTCDPHGQTLDLTSPRNGGASSGGGGDGTGSICMHHPCVNPPTRL
jgi:hypothetical protein